MKANTRQIIILVFLLAVLGFAAFRMISVINEQNRPRSAPDNDDEAGDEAEAEETASNEGGTPSATNMPPVPGAGGNQNRVSETQKYAGFVNENMFTQFSLNAQKNPFVQQEDWYANVLEEKVPGYPEIRDSGYFDGMEDFVPAQLLEALPTDEEWSSIRLNKTKQNPSFQIDAVSEDGSITTSITADAGQREDIAYQWTRGSEVPLSALASPGASQRVGRSTEPQAGPGGVVIPDLGDGPSGINEDNGAAAVGGGFGESYEDAIICRGVNLKNGRSAALIDYNGQAYLVQIGSVLPTHYQVMAIKEDGVILQELRDGSSKFVPVSANGN